MEKNINDFVDSTIKLLIKIKEFEAIKDLPALNNPIKIDNFNRMADAFKGQEDLRYIGESIGKLHLYVDRPYILEIQIGCIISQLLTIKNKENILIKFSHN